jgi:hypothetical protein
MLFTQDIVSFWSNYIFLFHKHDTTVKELYWMILNAFTLNPTSSEQSLV